MLIRIFSFVNIYTPCELNCSETYIKVLIHLLHNSWFGYWSITTLRNGSKSALNGVLSPYMGRLGLGIWDKRKFWEVNLISVLFFSEVFV